jgi:hypothetical protein
MPTHKRTYIVFLLVASLLILSCKIGGQAAPTPTPVSIPGWEKFSAGGVELWMPGNFQGGDLANDLDVIVQRLRAFGPEYEQMANTIEQNPSAFVMLILDSNIGPSGFLTNVNVVKEQVSSTTSIDSYMKASTSQLTPLGFTILEQNNVQLGSNKAGRLVIQSDKLKAKELMYVVKNKNTMWVITYATGIPDFANRLPTFEKSINTFRIQP